MTIECFNESPISGQLIVDRTLDGAWRQIRGHRKLTARSQLVGHITCPEHLWSIDLSARYHWIAVTPSTGSSEIALPTSGETFIDEADFEMNGDRIDLGSDFPDATEFGLHRIADLLPNLPGLERVICAPDWGTLVDRCYMLRWINDGWQEVWHTDLDYFGNFAGGSRQIIGDFDLEPLPLGCGRREQLL